ncbi:MAG: toll/interleukin-1 receptor domain-containing protein [Verrucomicrobia bacterium]|nr:toll/interleukin-1 receptor domain-containing protein [Verrucomicrobiota bacterium]
MRQPRRRRPQEVFISHAHQDRAFVATLTLFLHRHGIGYWYSPKHIVGAQQWHDQIGKALARCDWFLVVLSPSAVKSKWVGHEYFYALDDDRYAGRIVPVFYKRCNWKRLSWTLRRYQWVDFTKPYDLACRDLLRAWGLRG